MVGPVRVIGAGVAGLTCALVLAQRGCAVEIIDRAAGVGQRACSWKAGGMLAPWCEAESADVRVAEWGARAADLWEDFGARVERRGTLVVAMGRDVPELQQFARRTRQYRRVGADEIAGLEPALAGRFQAGLFFDSEAHLNPRETLVALAQRLAALGVVFHWNMAAETAPPATGPVVDCRGLTAQDSLPALRGVKGEMLMLNAPGVALSRPVRLLHPRVPLYVVPRGDGLFMVGATMIEGGAGQYAAARSVLELLSSAYALVPGLGEAELVEIGVDARPAFADNVPDLHWAQGRLHVNGLYRHGFLLAPIMALRAAQVLLDGASIEEVMHGYPGQRRSA
jgi:glycine oxidase